MTQPKVSIIIPVYNGANYLSNSIDCALRQTYVNKEIIVVNDGSTDNGETEKIAKSYGDKITYISKQNGGVSSALNEGIKRMNGEYFSWLSHDDLYTDDKISSSIDLLIKNGQINRKCIAFTSGYFIDADCNKLGSFKTYFKENVIYSGKEVVDIMTKKGTLNGCCMLIPRQAFDDAGLFNVDLRYSQDSLMWYNIFLADYSLISDNKSNVMYRLHRNQASQLHRSLYEKDSLAIAKVLATPIFKSDVTGRIFYQYTKRLTKNCCDQAISYLLKYSKENKVLTFPRILLLRAHKVWGHIRFALVNIVKKMMIRNR